VKSTFTGAADKPDFLKGTGGTMLTMELKLLSSTPRSRLDRMQEFADGGPTNYDAVRFSLRGGIDERPVERVLRTSRKTRPSA
jgi:hypothetical protein